MVEKGSKPITPEAVFKIYLSQVQESIAEFKKSGKITGSAIKSSVGVFAQFAIEEEPYFPQQIVVSELPVLSNPDILRIVIYEPRTNKLYFGERTVEKFQDTGDEGTLNIINLTQEERVASEGVVIIANNSDWLEYGEDVLEAVRRTLDSLREKAKKEQNAPAEAAAR